MVPPTPRRTRASTRSASQPSWVAYLSVLPGYRERCVRLLKDRHGDDLLFFASEAHLDPTVRTAVSAELYEETRLVRLRSALYVQLGHVRTALGAGSVIVELNPRSITAWFILLARKMLGRRTVVWGHLHPIAGPGSRTARLRRLMRRQADGMLCYTEGQARVAREEVPGQDVWVAPNSLYRVDELTVRPPNRDRTDVVYTGRMVASKRVGFLLEAFAVHARANADSRLVLVGDGPDRADLLARADQLGLAPRVVAPGWVEDVDELRDLYAGAFCSASPGFAGLGLTQSVGFGVVQAVAEGQPHSPEIELAEVPGAVHWFDGREPEHLAAALDQLWSERGRVPDATLQQHAVDHFSAEAMATGFEQALGAGRETV